MSGKSERPVTIFERPANWDSMTEAEQEAESLRIAEALGFED